MIKYNLLLRLLVVSHIFAGNMVYSEKECSRPLSRDIRKYFFKYVPVSLNALPLQCPFHPDNDMLYDQELNKRDLHRGEWQVRHAISSLYTFKCCT